MPTDLNFLQNFQLLWIPLPRMRGGLLLVSLHPTLQPELRTRHWLIKAGLMPPRPPAPSCPAFLVLWLAAAFIHNLCQKVGKPRTNLPVTWMRSTGRSWSMGCRPGLYSKHDFFWEKGILGVCVPSDNSPEHFVTTASRCVNIHNIQYIGNAFLCFLHCLH